MTGETIRFTFDGRQLTGRQGDTLAAALLRNGIHLVARSFKYHRPRGIVAAGVDEPNAFVRIGSGGRADPVAQATMVELYEGLAAHSLHAWPSPRFDVAGLLGAFGRFLPAGFYYKTFFQPNWHTFEGLIRRMAGLGSLPDQRDPDRYERTFAHCDVLVVGSGPAGVSAALAAAHTGASVTVLEQDSMGGGSLIWEDTLIDGSPGRAWAAQSLETLRAMPNVTIMLRTTASGYFDANLVTAVEDCSVHGSASPDRARLRFWHFRAAQVVLATGAIERPAVFPGNDRPGIMQASAMRHYAGRFGVMAGRTIVIATNNDDAYRTAHALSEHGVRIAAIADSRTGSSAQPPAGVPVHYSSVIARTAGYRRVRSVEIRSLADGSGCVISCDAVAMSGGWSPAVQLFSQSGGKLRYDEGITAFVPHTAAQKTIAAGAADGRLSLAECLASGHQAGAEAAFRVTARRTQTKPAETVQTAETATGPIWRVPREIAGSRKQWVDFHNDVTAGDVVLAARENFHSVEHLKRYTTLGMASDQGKTSNVNGLGIMGEETGRDPAEVGTTTFRPPYSPLTFAAIAGRDRGALHHPRRHLPTHSVQVANGAAMEDYGQWYRPAYHPLPGEGMAEAVTREVAAVRNGVGVIDYSPLGKIEVWGRDAAEFLNRVVTTNATTMKPGDARYSLTLTESGVIRDDGVITRLADGAFIMGTTSGAVAPIAARMEELLQCEWPDLHVAATDITAQWGVVMISGPKARILLSRLDCDIDLGAEAFPHMTMREGRIGGVPARIARVSFTGEVSFEISVPQSHASALWQELFRHGSDLGICAFGIEALDVLRAEKGFFHVGTDTDGTTIPDDVGFGGMTRNKKTDFIGRRSLSLPGNCGARRAQLVGLQPLDGDRPLAVGAQIANPRETLSSGEGTVTTSLWSPTLARPIALALLADGRARMGETIHVWNNRKWRTAQVVSPRFHDPDGELLRG